MTNPFEAGRTPKPKQSNMTVPLAVGFGAFAVGVGLTFGYVQWQAQQQQLTEMAAMVQEMQQQQQQAQNDVVTRNAPADLLSLTSTVAAATAPASPEVVATPVAAPAPAPAAPVDNVARTTADRIKALVARSNDPLVSAAIAQDVARRETMSVAIQGVNELVTAAVAGNYALSTEEEGRLRINFPGHEEDQRQLERLLSSAAEAGMIAFADSVRSSDGTFNGPIILFDLVERSLLNGTAAEKETGLNLRREALALTAQNNSVQTTAQTTTGDRLYTVEPGDSLAYISLQFYGNTNAYLRIFQANRNLLSSPDKIEIGQKLRIPTI